MNIKTRLVFYLTLVLPVLSCAGRDIYVATNGPGGGDPLFGAWTSAASRIEWAVNAGTNEDMVWISNGVYVLTNQVTVNSNLTIRGNPGELAVVDGNNANRCFYFPSTVNRGGLLSNLFITRGYTNMGPGAGVYMRYGTIQDCVFSNNVCAGTNGGGLTVGSLFTGIVENTVIYLNSASLTVNSNHYFGLTNWFGGSLSNCCFSPELYPSYTNIIAVSANNITNDPRFIEPAAGNYRLDRESPCLNAGVVRDWMGAAADLDGFRRVDVFGGSVDIGCYEHTSSGSLIKIQ